MENIKAGLIVFGIPFMVVAMGVLLWRIMGPAMFLTMLVTGIIIATAMIAIFSKE